MIAAFALVAAVVVALLGTGFVLGCVLAWREERWTGGAS